MMPSMRRGFLACYAFSGAAALLYEVVWSRLFTLALGQTVAAASTVLAAFMGGMAAGAWTAGRTQVPEGRRLHAYAALEIGTGALALAVPFALHALTPALAWAYDDGNAPARFAVLRVALSLGILGLPAAAMGATFPIAAAWIRDASDRARQGRADSGDVGILYAVNTCGAAIGAIAAGYWLIPAIGLRLTSWVAVALNVAAASGTLLLARRHRGAVALPPRATSTANRPARTPIAAPALPSMRRYALAAAALAGCAGLVYEVFWPRLLAMVIGPTTYAFATMTAAFITGIAIGSAVGARLGARRAVILLPILLIVPGVPASAAPWFAASQLPLLAAARVAASAKFSTVLP